MNTNNAGSATSIDLAELQRFNNRSGLMNPEPWGLYVRYEQVEALARATPQHSVTEQALSDPQCDEAIAKALFQRALELKLLVSEVSTDTAGHQTWGRAGAALAQPLASTSATQPEQADAARYRYLRDHQDEGVEFRDGNGEWRSDCPSGKELDSIIDAALAIPASTAASEQQAGALPCNYVDDFDRMETFQRCTVCSDVRYSGKGTKCEAAIKQLEKARAAITHRDTAQSATPATGAASAALDAHEVRRLTGALLREEQDALIAYLQGRAPSRDAEGAAQAQADRIVEWSAAQAAPATSKGGDDEMR